MLVTSIGLVAKVAAIGREVLIAALAGATRGVDAFFIALVVPATIGSLLGTATHAAFLPVLARLEDDTRERRDRFVNTVLFGTAAIGFPLTGVAIVFAEPLVSVIGPGLGPAGVREAAAALRLVAPLLILSPLEGLIAAIYQIRGRVGFASTAIALNSVVTLVGVALAWPTVGITALPLATLAGATASVLLLVVGLPSVGHRLWPAFDRDSTHIRTMAVQMGPLVFASSILISNTAIDRAVASTLGVGAVAALAFGSRLIYSPLDLVTNGINSVVFPRLARAGTGDSEGAGPLLARALRSAMPLLLPVVVLAVLTASLGVRILYERGEFTREAAAATTQVVVFLAPLLLLIAYQGLLVRSFQARLHTMPLAILAILNAGLNLALNLVLAPRFGVAGVALSTTLTITIVVSLMWWLARDAAGFRVRDSIRGWPSAAAVALVVAVAGWLVGSLVPDDGSPPAAVLVAGSVWLTGLGIVLFAARLGGPREPVLVMGVLASSLRSLIDVGRRWSHRARHAA